MTGAKLVLEYVEVLVWPLLILVLVSLFRRQLTSIMTRPGLRIELFGVVLETTADEFEGALNENLRGMSLTPEQWSWMERLEIEGRVPYNHLVDYELLRPLRNAGLVWEYPEGHLTDAAHVSISPLGRLLLRARKRSR